MGDYLQRTASDLDRDERRKSVDGKRGTAGSLKLPSDSQEPTHNWKKFKPSIFFKCFNVALQLVLLGGCGSFLFGFCLSGLNTATDMINSSFLQCGGDGAIWGRFNGVSEETCKRFSDCSSGSSGCKIVDGIAVCEGGYNQKYGSLSIEQCEASEECTSKCGVVEKGVLTKVRCPGGHNDISCPSITWYKSSLTTSVLIGATIGSLTGSRLLVLGRRTVLLATMVIFLIGVTSCTVANSFQALLWARLIVGYAVGLVSVASPTYMSEVTPKDRRGSYGVVHQLGIVIGIFLSIILGLALDDPADHCDKWAPGLFQLFWWRFMVALPLLPTLFALYLLGFVYTFDTPVWYVEQRRFKDAASLLALIHGTDDIKEELDSVIENVRQGEISKEAGMNFKKALKNSEYRHVIIVGCLLSAFQQFGGINVFVTSSNDIFKKAGLSGKMQTMMSCTMGLINIVMTFPTLFLIERMGRRSLMLIGSSMQAVCVLPAAIMYWINKDSQITQILAIVAVLGFVTFFALAYGPVLWVYLFEIYPMEIKDVAAGVATSVNWVAGVVMVFVSGLLPNQVAYSIFAALQTIGSVLIFLLMRETRGLALGESPFITKKNQV